MKLIDAYTQITVQLVKTIRAHRFGKQLGQQPTERGAMRIREYETLIRALYDQMILQGHDAPLGELEPQFNALVWPDWNYSPFM